MFIVSYLHLQTLGFCFNPFMLPGGPGFESPRPSEASGWLKSAVGSFRVVLMDQRGTGRSSAITTANLAGRGTPEQQAEYLSFFR
jgi:pimeloyl-ACP methyl ester carboxylesterase